jgi:hypothetical protein
VTELLVTHFSLTRQFVLTLKQKDLELQNKARTANSTHKTQVKALRLLELQETQFQKNILLINEMRRVILQRYCKK